MKFKLSTKVSALVCLSMLAYLVVSVFLVQRYRDESRRAEDIVANVTVLQGVSQLINNLQVERGMSGSYMTGGAQLAQVQERQAKTDEAIKELKSVIGLHRLPPEEIQKATRFLESLESLRSSVEAKSVAPKEAIDQYTANVLGMLGLFRLTAATSDVADLGRRVTSLSVLEEAKENAGKFRANVTAIISKDEPIDSARLESVTNFKGGVDASVKSPALLVTDKNLEAIRSFTVSPQWTHVSGVFREILAKSTQGKYGKNANEFFQAISKAIEDLWGIVTYEQAYIKDYATKIASEKTAAVWMLITSVLVVFGVVGVVCFFIIRGIVRPIGQIMEQLDTGATHLTSASSQVIASSDAVASGAQQQAASLEESSATLETIASMAKHNSESAHKASVLADSMGKVSEEGAKAMSRMSKAIQDIKTSANETADILKMIDDIAFQTNLLALNAAVEAARAGDAGKGFAVVAEEVRNLAQRSAKAAKETSDRIKRSVDLAENGVTVSKEVDKVLSEVRDSSLKSAELIKEIAKASGDQSSGINEISNAVAQLDSVTQANAAAAEENSASSHEMAAQARLMENIASRLGGIVYGSHADDRKQYSNSGSDMSVNGCDMPDTDECHEVRTFTNKRGSNYDDTDRSLSIMQ